MDIKHPAHELNRGVPSRATVGTDDYAIDEEDYLTIDDEADAVQAMDRLGQTYGVTYADDGEIEADSTPNTPGSSGEDGAADEADDTAEGDTAADDGEALAQAAADADELQSMDMDELRDRADEVGVDRDAVDMRQKDEVVAAIMRAQTETVDGGGE